MCDVDERWNGPPPRCDPIFCPEPASIRNGGFSLSTNSTVMGTVATYYCTSSRHVLVGVPKLNCKRDGTWDGSFPECRLREVPKAPVVPSIRPADPSPPTSRFPIDRETLLRRPILKANLPFNKDGTKDDLTRPIRRKPFFAAGAGQANSENNNNNPDPRFPIRNEIPDSANVRADLGPEVNVPVGAVQNGREARTQQLNLGEKSTFSYLVDNFKDNFKLFQVAL